MSVLRALVDELERDPELVARLRRLLGAGETPPAFDGTPAAMRADDFAKHVGLSRRRIFDLAAKGLPCIGEGRARRVDVAPALAWLRAGADRGTPKAAADAELDAVARDAATRAQRRRRGAK